MRFRFLNVVLLSGLLAAAWAAQNEPVTFDDNVGDLYARFKNGHLWNLATDNPKFEAKGDPKAVAPNNTVIKNSEGLQIDANLMKGSFTRKKDKSTKVESTNIDEVQADGNVVILYRSDLARKYQTLNSLKVTEDPGIETKLTSDTALFNQNGTDDMVTLSKPFVLTDNRPGKSKTGEVLSASKATGTSGVIHFLAPEKGKKAKLRTAEIEGPVHYHLVQTSMDVHTGKPQIKTYDLEGDHLSADQTNPVGKIVLTGHVKWSYSMDAQELHGTCSKLIATTDEDGNITDLETTNNNVSGQDVPVETHP